MYVLGIESSCDETAAAVLSDGPRLLSNIVATQVQLHTEYGGVVPELASREHLKNIRPVVDMALLEAGIGIADVGAIAVTQGPGLVGSLLVGVSFAKALAFARKIPLVAINHLEGHVFAVELEHGPIPYPALIFILSGGHSTILLSTAREDYSLVAQTRDDAAGEAFDKVAKLVGLGYPGGPVIDRLSDRGNRKAFEFPIARTSDGSLDLSFSGIKSAVARMVHERSIPTPEISEGDASQVILDVCASFQYAVIQTILNRAKRAAEYLHPNSIILTGGVACNRGIRRTFTEYFAASGIPVLYPRPVLTTDNAAMIAAAAFPKIARGEFAGPDLNAFAVLPLTQRRTLIPSRLLNN